MRLSVSADSACLVSLCERWQHTSGYLDDCVANTEENAVFVSSRTDLRASRKAFALLETF